MPPAARLSDMHVCPMVTGVVPHVGGPILPACFPKVLTGGMPQARVSDLATCVGPPDMIAVGSATVYVGGQLAARMGDITQHGGTIVTGCPTVIIGDAGGGPAESLSNRRVTPRMGAEGGNADAAAQAKALIGAGKDGAPFSEQCQKDR